MNYNSVRTIYLADLEFYRSLGLPFQLEDHSTLNEYFDIMNDAVLPENVYPTIKYLAIGRGGHANISGSNGADKSRNLEHDITDAVLKEHIPFLVTQIINGVEVGVTIAERAGLRMRKVFEKNGNTYVAYYVKVINIDSARPTKTVFHTENSVTTSTPYIATPAQLAPVMYPPSNGETVESTSKHISSSINLSMNLDKTDINNIIDACLIIYGDAEMATISEVALVSGIDTTNSNSEGTNVAVTYTELVAAQCCNFTGQRTELTRNSRVVGIDFDLNSVRKSRI